MVASEISTDTYTTTATTETSDKKNSSLLSPIEESDSVERNAPKMVSVKFMVYVSLQIIYFPQLMMFLCSLCWRDVAEFEAPDYVMF